MRANNICLGHVTKAHGLKGSAFIQIKTLDDAVLRPGLAVTLFPLSDKSVLPEEGLTTKMISFQASERAKCQFEGILDRTQLESMLPLKVTSKRSDWPPLAPAEYYWEDIKEFAVAHKGKPLGNVIDLFHNGAQVVCVIQTLQNKVVEVPFVEAFVKQVDVEKKTIEIEMPVVVE